MTDLENAALIAFIAENPGTLYTIQALIQKIKDAIAALGSPTVAEIVTWIQTHP